MITDEQRARARRAAIAEICPNSMEPTTPYEIGAVKRLTAFGLRLLGDTYGQNNGWGTTWNFWDNEQDAQYDTVEESSA